MRIGQIKNNITRIDKNMAAVECETHENTVNAVIRGAEILDKDPFADLGENDRNPFTPLGRKIIKELTRLAKINIKAKAAKQISKRKKQTV